MKIIQNKYGYYEIKNKPDNDELEKYYADKYYQNEMASHKKEYSATELSYIENKIAQKYLLIKDKIDGSKNPKLLDVGCGEGFTLKFFKSKGWNITGLDYSVHGIETQNPDCINEFISGDIYQSLNKIKEHGEKFDLIWLDNVLEHVVNPKDLVNTCYSLGQKGSLMIIEVPNDFSVVQRILKEEEHVDKDYWIALPDHLSYFNLEGLRNLVQDCGWVHYDSIADFPIEFNLFNPETNYVNDKTKGKLAHFQRLKVENIMNDISLEKTVDIYRILAEMGLGRQIASVFIRE